RGAPHDATGGRRFVRAGADPGPGKRRPPRRQCGRHGPRLHAQWRCSHSPGDLRARGGAAVGRTDDAMPCAARGELPAHDGNAAVGPDEMLQSFRNAPASRQLMIVGALGLVLCIALVAVYFLFLRTSYAVLYRDLREADAATITAELERTHIDYRLADGGQTLMVPEGAVDTTRLHVASRDLPLQGTVGFELFNTSSIGLSDFAPRIYLQR